MSTVQPNSLFKNVAEAYGRETLNSARYYESLTKKVARYRNHLVFTLRCKQRGMVPVNLRLKCPINTRHAKDIVSRTERSLLNERVHIINGKLNSLRAQRQVLIKSLQATLSAQLWNQLTQQMQVTENAEFSRSKEIQVQKFNRLIAQSTDKGKRGGSKDSRWIVNISSRDLDGPERSVLSKGLNFVVSPSRIPVEEFVAATEKICSQLEPQKADALRSEVTFALNKAKPGTPNLSKDEREAIKRLRRDESIQVLPADKGRATVIMDKEEYETKVKEMLDDEKTYVKLEKDLHHSIKRHWYPS